jgi:two-component system NarL family response regulator
MTRVIIISNYLMFSYGLESLLREQDGLDIVACEQDIAQAIESIKELKPDVVILDCDDPAQHPTWGLMHILSIRPKIKVICMSLQSNNLRIFQARRWITKDVEDLLAAITDEPDDL